MELDPSLPPDLPEFGGRVPRRAEPCSARELFCGLFVDLEEHVHCFEPAFELALSLLHGVQLPPIDPRDGRDFAAALLDWGQGALCPLPQLEFASSWPVRVVREFAPFGLSDGAWLRGATSTNAIETEVGMKLLKQFMIRFGDPASGEAYVQRYAALLRSLGIAPDLISRWEWDEAAPCCDVSYEHALLGLALGLFPSTLGLETLGYNLWMAAIGPCPLLEQLVPGLRRRGAALRYLDMHDRGALRDLAQQAVQLALRGSDGTAARRRIARGFVAAQRSYERWQQAMLGRNIPMSAREFVLEGIKRKARFSADHHRDVQLRGHSLQQLLLGGRAGHEKLLELLAQSLLIRPGAPEQSRFMTHSISIEGPMFDAFTAPEKLELAEWIASLPERENEPRTAREPEPRVATAGVYTAPRDPASLERFAQARFGDKGLADLFYYFANADLYPAVRLFAKTFVAQVFAVLERALASDPRLRSSLVPAYSEESVARIVAEQHANNVRSRAQRGQPSRRRDEREEAAKGIQEVFDGSWLQGFADVRRADFEEYGWLFRIYASEHGDGDFSWNHCQIFRRAFCVLGPPIALPKTDRRLYDAFEIGIAALTTLAASLNTRTYMPELLGINLGIESTGVGGSYMDDWKYAHETGSKWRALAWRLHNSIDNYADGHTKWSLAAVQAFMRRVRDGCPGAVPEQWARIWRLWRVREILSHGSDQERAALAGLFGASSQPTAAGERRETAP